MGAEREKRAYWDEGVGGGAGGGEGLGLRRTQVTNKGLKHDC